jgi:hypothetical protein
LTKITLAAASFFASPGVGGHGDAVAAHILHEIPEDGEGGHHRQLRGGRAGIALGKRRGYAEHECRGEQGTTREHGLLR